MNHVNKFLLVITFLKYKFILSIPNQVLLAILKTPIQLQSFQITRLP